MFFNHDMDSRNPQCFLMGFRTQNLLLNMLSFRITWDVLEENA